MNKTFLILLILSVFFCCKQPEARYPISVKSGSFIKASAERNKKLYAHEKSQIEKLMKQHTNRNYIASTSGFWYYYNTKVENDSLETPNFGDVINYNYNVKALNGNVIYTKEAIKTQNYAMDREELFTGLREGLKLLKTGETATFLFPSQKAYGYYGDENKIGSNMPLICEVTINSIIQNSTN